MHAASHPPAPYHALPAAAGLAAEMPASQSPTRIGCTASPLRPACGGRACCPDRGGAARLSRSACNGRARR
eukprot:scaffold66778_cov50-Phaeocystis_antarctica.AAC.1